MHCTDQNIDKLHKVLMKSVLLCLAAIVSKTTTSYIGRKCKWNSNNVTIKMSVLNIILE